MKKKIILFVICMCTIFATACSKNKKEVVENLTECSNLVLPDGYVPEMVQEVEQTNQLFVTGFNLNTSDYENMYHLFRLDQTNTGYETPKEIALDDAYVILKLVVSHDGKQVYFSAYLKEEVKEGEFESASYHIYKGDLETDKISNIEAVEEINKKQISALADVDSQENLYFASFDYNAPSTAYRAVKKKDGYELEELSLAEEVKSSVNAFFLDEKQQAIMANSNGENELTEFYLVEFDGNKTTKSTELQMPEEISEEQIYSFTLSTEDHMCYIITIPDAKNMQTRKIYKISLSALLNNQKEETTYEPCSYDNYDTSDFEMKYRKKGNMAEKQGVYYEIFVRSFADSDGDGIGDLNGVTKKLDYLKELGIDGIWLMPINASPSYHGYDVTDYNSINPDYGTKEDFETLLKEAHKRNIKVVMDFVINHTSSEHPWFQSAIADENSEYRNYYRWVKKSDKADYSVSDVSNWGEPVWHKNGTDYYYGIFSADMPDLNYNNPKVREEMIKAAKGWLELGVDGFRLDAAMHIYGDNEFKQQKNALEANLQWWNEFAIACEKINPDVYLIGEAWQETESLPEYAQPFDTKFNFTFESDMIAAIQEEKAMSASGGTRLAESLETILKQYAEYDKNFIDGVFASNHDQNRILSQVKTEEKAKLAANIYLTLPGNPFIYYGEELGMLGEKPDENIREPFKWSKDGSDMDTTWEEDASNKNTMSLMEQQLSGANTMYHHYRKMIAFRKAHTALTEGSYTAVDVGNDAVLAYIRESKEETLFVIHNLSAEETVIQEDSLAGGEVLYDGLDKDILVMDGDKVKVRENDTVVVKLGK